MNETTVDPLVFGRRLRHLRRQQGLTLDDLARRVGKHGPYLSLVENGKREPRLSLIQALALELDVPVTDLLAGDAPTRRSRLEIDLQRAQDEPLYASLRLPRLVPSSKLPDEALEHLLALYHELRRQARVRTATPEEARRSNAQLRVEMRARDNYFAEIEQAAAEALAAVRVGDQEAIAQSQLNDLAHHFGFTIHPAQGLPTSTRSLTDLRRRRIYIPQRNELRTRAARSVVLQTLGHFALGHGEPRDFGDFLRQRIETNYFAGAILVPEARAVPFLREAKRRRDLSVEDLKEVFYVSYEMAAHRFTNLATRHLDVRTHFIRSDQEGIAFKAYENDGLPFPADPQGAIEGMRLCRHSSARRVFTSAEKFDIHYQWTDTPAGTFWCGTHVEVDADEHHAITVGVRFDDAHHFRGRNTQYRELSQCPDGDCCRRPPPEALARWEGASWPSARVHSHVLATLPAGTFPGVDLTEVYDFLDRHETAEDLPPDDR